MKPIPEYPAYSITRDGRVWSDKRQKYLQSKPNYQGYLIVSLYNCGKRRVCRVHHLILETFVGSCPEGAICKHLNEDKTDNRLKNLKWETLYDKAQDSIKRGTHTCLRLGEIRNNAKLTEAEVLQIRTQYSTGSCTYRNLAKIYNVTHSMIGYIIRRENWTHVL